MLTRLSFGSICKLVTMEISMVEVDFGGQELGKSGAIIVAAFLPKCM
jgi:hypothetical protein